jgi:hypothetical protein
MALERMLYGLEESIANAKTFPPLVSLAIGICSTLIIGLLYKLFFDPLSNIPATSWFAKLSSLPLWYATYRGRELSTISSMHKIHGPVVRLSPSEVSIADGELLTPIYVTKGGFRKPS